jgi:hypothetical protein
MDGEAKLPMSNGNAVRVLRVTTLVDGAPLTVEMPVIALADANGKLLPLTDERRSQAMLLELRAIRMGIQALLERRRQAAQDDLLELATSTLDIVRGLNNAADPSARQNPATARSRSAISGGPHRPASAGLHRPGQGPRPLRRRPAVRRNRRHARRGRAPGPPPLGPARRHLVPRADATQAGPVDLGRRDVGGDRAGLQGHDRPRLQDRLHGQHHVDRHVQSARTRCAAAWATR